MGAGCKQSRKVCVGSGVRGIGLYFIRYKMGLPHIPDGNPAVPKFFAALFSGIIPQKRTDRTMKYPYTMSAKIAHFPYGYHWRKVWLFRWMIYTSIFMIPIWRKIGQATYAPANVAKWKEIRAGYYKHEEH